MPGDRWFLRLERRPVVRSSHSERGLTRQLIVLPGHAVDEPVLLGPVQRMHLPIAVRVPAPVCDAAATVATDLSTVAVSLLQHRPGRRRHPLDEGVHVFRVEEELRHRLQQVRLATLRGQPQVARHHLQIIDAQHGGKLPSGRADTQRPGEDLSHDAAHRKPAPQPRDKPHIGSTLQVRRRVGADQRRHLRLGDQATQRQGRLQHLKGRQVKASKLIIRIHGDAPRHTATP